MDCSPPGSSVHGIFQARILQWVAISFSRGSFWPKDRTWVSCIAGRVFTGCTDLAMKSLSRVQLCDPMDCSLSSSSIHGIFQARVLEWTAISFSKGSSRPRNQTRSPTLQADALLSEPPLSDSAYFKTEAVLAQITNSLAVTHTLFNQHFLFTTFTRGKAHHKKFYYQKEPIHNLTKKTESCHSVSWYTSVTAMRN